MTKSPVGGPATKKGAGRPILVERQAEGVDFCLVLADASGLPFNELHVAAKFLGLFFLACRVHPQEP